MGGRYSIGTRVDNQIWFGIRIVLMIMTQLLYIITIITAITATEHRAAKGIN